MTEQELIALKERIALLTVGVPEELAPDFTPPMFTPAERDYLLDAINQRAAQSRAVLQKADLGWSCGHTAGAVCKECHEALIARANSIAAALHHELDEGERLRAEIRRLREIIDLAGVPGSRSK